MKKRGYISLNTKTKEILDSIRAPGQSYDGIIQQLIRLYDEVNKQYIVISHDRDDPSLPAKRV